MCLFGNFYWPFAKMQSVKLFQNPTKFVPLAKIFGMGAYEKSALLGTLKRLILHT